MPQWSHWPLRSQRQYQRFAVAVLATLMLPAAHAGLFNDDEARQRVEQVRKSLEQTQAQVATLSTNQLDFANQLETLRGEMAKLRGQLEVLTYDLETTQKRQQDFYVDLDNRLRKLETPDTSTSNDAAAATAGSSSTSTAAPSTPAVADTEVYEKAVNALKAGKAKEAMNAFDAFIPAYPQSKLLGSAHYWSAYAHSQVKDYKGAAFLFGKFADTWPDDPRAPDALEAQADNLVSAKDSKGAQSALQRLAQKYPASEAGKRAAASLKKK